MKATYKPLSQKPAGIVRLPDEKQPKTPEGLKTVEHYTDPDGLALYEHIVGESGNEFWFELVVETEAKQ